jgi:aldehyde dehydrogenase (NAD(P)+)
MNRTVAKEAADRGAKSDLQIELIAPNKRKYTQPIGLFINNEFVPSSNGQKLTSINPT